MRRERCGFRAHSAHVPLAAVVTVQNFGARQCFVLCS